MVLSLRFGCVPQGCTVVVMKGPCHAGPSPRRPGFAPGTIHVGSVVGKVALGQDFL
jgi:hypothetical protein